MEHLLHHDVLDAHATRAQLRPSTIDQRAERYGGIVEPLDTRSRSGDPLAQLVGVGVSSRSPRSAEDALRACGRRVAAIVRLGFDVATVGMLPQPAKIEVLVPPAALVAVPRPTSRPYIVSPMQCVPHDVSGADERSTAFPVAGPGNRGRTASTDVVVRERRLGALRTSWFQSSREAAMPPLRT